MKEIEITKKIKVFSIEDIKEAVQYIGEEGYFANSIEEFDCTVCLFELDKIEIAYQYDEHIFICDDGNYKLFAVIEG